MTRKVAPSLPRAATPEPLPAPARPSLGTLFEHYGVGLEQRAEQAAVVVEGQRCAGCGWIVREDEDHCRSCARALDEPDESDA